MSRSQLSNLSHVRNTTRSLCSSNYAPQISRAAVTGKKEHELEVAVVSEVPCQRFTDDSHNPVHDRRASTCLSQAPGPSERKARSSLIVVLYLNIHPCDRSEWWRSSLLITHPKPFLDMGKSPLVAISEERRWNPYHSLRCRCRC